MSSSVGAQGVDIKEQQAREMAPPATLSRAAELQMLRAAGKRLVLGLDEAGRGPLCGPVVAAAVVVLGDGGAEIEGVTDSKAVTREEDREATYERIVSNKAILWGVSIVSPQEIDATNILKASLAAMRRAAEDLLVRSKGKIAGADLLALIDGNKVPENLPTGAERFVIKGDSICYSIAAASIIAKVTRDRIMNELHLKHPVYKLSQHKGYPTFEHRKILYEVGPCDIYRFTFGPVRDAAARHNVSPPAPHSSATAAAGKTSTRAPAPPARAMQQTLAVKAATASALKRNAKKKEGAQQAAPQSSGKKRGREDKEISGSSDGAGRRRSSRLAGNVESKK